MRTEESRTCRLVRGVEVIEDAAELGVVAKVGDGGVAARDEDAVEGLELGVGDGAEGAGGFEVALELHAAEELLVVALGPPVAEVGEEGLGEGVDAGRLACGGRELR